MVTLTEQHHNIELYNCNATTVIIYISTVVHSNLICGYFVMRDGDDAVNI